MIKRVFNFFCLGLAFVSFVQAQNIESDLILNLRNGQVMVPRTAGQAMNPLDVDSWELFQDRRYGLVALAAFPDTTQWPLFEQLGVRILGFYPSRFYLVSIAASADLQVFNNYGVLAITNYESDFRWVGDFANVPSRALVGDGLVAVSIVPFADVELGGLVDEIAKKGWEVDTGQIDLGYMIVKLPLSDLELIQLQPGIQSIEWLYDRGEPENYTSRSSMRSNFISHDNSNSIAYDGTGVAVGIQDNGSIGPHIDFQGRIKAQFTTDNEGDHGDHVSGTVAGAGNLNPQHQGQAEGADLYVYKAAPQYNGITSVNDHYTAYDLFIISTSYSDGCNAGYTALTRTVDLQSYQRDKLVHVYSAGNSGTSNCGYGAGSAWGNITGGHKMGKNTVTVGNLSENDVLATSSSRGPAYDGRIKPDICAKGTNVTSTIQGNQYDTYNGTSMACPNVAGSLALLYEAYEDLYSEAPDAGVIKAAVLNTAEDLGNVGPDFKHGWGRLNARKAFSLLDQNNIIHDQLSSSSSPNQHQITVPADVSRMRVMLYWTDAPAAINAATALVNDLDLIGISPAMDSLFPYVLNPAANASTLDLPATTGVDHLNNMEQIEVMSPAQGTYSFYVDPYLVAQGPQDYYLVYWFEQEPLTLTYPVGGESFAPFTSEIIRWDANIAGNLAIEYSVNGGSSWNLIASSVDAQLGQAQWFVPFIAEGDVRVRLTQGAVQVVSDEFSVMPVPTGLFVEWACPDSIGLAWDPMASALGFDVYKLGVKYMDSIGSSLSNEFVDYTSNPFSSSLWYAVSSKGEDSAVSKRTLAILKTPGLLNCELSTDLNLVKMLPESNYIFSCHGNETTYGFIVENSGLNPVLGFEASLWLNGGQVNNQLFSTSIAPGDADTFFFSQPLNLVTGVNDVAVVINLTNDQNSYNDSLSIFIEKDDSEALLPLWTENFDSFDNCATDPDCGLTSCPLPVGWINAENGAFDDVDWRVHNATTPTQFTGPFGDNTLGSGKYVYIESSGDCSQQEGHLISPCIDLTDAEQTQLSFYYSMYGADMGTLHVDVFDGIIWHMDVMGPISGNQGTAWKNQLVDLSMFSGESINIRFRAVTGPSFRSDFALDDIMLSHPPIADFEYFTQPNGQTVLFEDHSAYADSMTFDLGDGSLLLDSVPSFHDYMQQTTYSVTQTVVNPFGQDVLTKTIINLGLKDAERADVIVFPNPTSGIMTLRLEDNLEAQSIEIHSLGGSLVYSESALLRRSIDLDLSNLASGTYVLKVVGKQSIERTIVVQ